MVCILNGFPKAGKSLFIEYCRELAKNKHINEYSTVDFVKHLAEHCGWDGSKTPENRKFLADLKQLLTEWNDLPFKKSVDTIEKSYKYADWLSIPHNKMIVFIHCREPKEIQKFKDYYGDDCITVLLRRAAIENNDQSNNSDTYVLDYPYDEVLYNNGTFEELMEVARKFLVEHLGEDVLK